MKNSSTGFPLAVRGLSKSYGDLQAVRNLTFRVGEGEIFGLLGPNGAGKSTTLECVLGITPADSGEISLLGSHQKKREGKLFERVGVQFQDSHYPDHINVIELCRMISVLYSHRSDWRSLLFQFGLSGKEKTPVSDLSGGERQKLSLLLAMINKPDILFLDELTTGLDPRARRDVWAYITALKEQGMTVLLTSHYMEEVRVLCDRVLIMNKGIEIISGTPESIIEQSRQGGMEEAYLHFIEKEASDEQALKAL